MEAEDWLKIDLDFESRGSIDSVHFLGLNAYESDGFLNGGKQVDTDLFADVDDHLIGMCELKPAQTRTSKRYNLRKSLAWDTAFFTSAGVLDPEELSSMITEADKGEKCLLPGIHENLTGSIESLSSLESEILYLETLEEDLFVDIRASIVRSCEKMSNWANSSRKKTEVEVDSVPILALEKKDDASQHKNSKPGSRKTSGLLQTKSLPKQNIEKQGSGKAGKQDVGCSQVTSIAKIGERSLIINSESKTVSKSVSTTMTAKREPIRIGLGKSVTFNKGTELLNVFNGTTRTLQRPAVSSKPSLLASSTTARAKSAKPYRSGEGSGVSSVTHTKSQLPMARRIPSKSGTEGSAPSVSRPKTSRVEPKKEPAPSTMSASCVSSKVSSSVSPTSSISEWSSVSSSSSSSMINHRFHTSRTSPDTSSSGSIDIDANFLHQRNPLVEQTVNEYKNQRATSPISSSKNSTRNDTVLASMKPSGLRKPSPKIGFFDAVKSSHPHNGNQLPQLAIQTVFPKTSAPIGAKDSPNLSFEITDNANGERCQKPEEFCAEWVNLSVLDLHDDNGRIGDIRTGFMGGHTSTLKVFDRVGDRLVNQNYFEHNSHPRCIANEKENENAHDKYQGQGIIGSPYQDNHFRKNKLLSGTLGSKFTLPAKAAVKRSPLVIKNELSGNVCFDASKELGTPIATADKISFVLPACEQKVNS